MNINNILYLPTELLSHVLCESGLFSYDWENCQKVCKLFNEIVGSEDNCKQWVKVFDPEKTWTKNVTWKQLVINFKIAERKTLDLLALQNKDHDFKKNLEETQIFYLMHFMFSDNIEIRQLISDSFLNGKGCPKDEKTARHYSEMAVKQGYTPVPRNGGSLDIEKQTLDLLALQDKDQNFKKTLKETQYFYLTHFLNSTNPEILKLLGDSYLYRKGCSNDVFTAIQYFKQSNVDDSQWDATVQYNIGLCYFKGIAGPLILDKAIYYFKLAADQGYAKAQYKLGMCYEQGRGCEKNPDKAFHYLKLAAEQGYDMDKERQVWSAFKVKADQGDPDAQFDLGRCYLKGTGCKPDCDQAFSYFKLAANQGHVGAQYELGELYSNSGKSTIYQQDFVQAFSYFQLAAKEGHAGAQCRLGSLYLSGQGCQLDYAQAFHYLELAAFQGHPYALFTLGCCYERGVGCQKDEAKAQEYLILAQKAGEN